MSTRRSSLGPLIIDPATSRLVSVTNYQGTVEIVRAEWTDDMLPVFG
jgi:hypothetical protein